MQAAACGPGPRPSNWWAEAERVHRLQNELTAARAAAQLAREHCCCGAGERYLARALSALDRAVAVLQEVATTQEASLASPTEPVDLWRLVVETVRDFTDVLARSRIEVTLEGEPAGTIWVEGIPPLLRAAVANVLTNAAEAMPSGGSLKVALHELAPPAPEGQKATGGHWVRLSVEDTGPGIPASALPVLFKMPVSTKRHSGGGLGLLVTHEIVTRLHAGRLSAANREGGGARISIELPCRVAGPSPESASEGG